MPVCITGMHRSGTSMVARLLNLCGLYLGDEADLIPPNPANAEGFWENRRFVDLNDGLLASLGGGWDLPPMMADGWERGPGTAALRAQAQELVHHFAAHEPWGWKDPRSALTLALWQGLLPGLKVVICLRHPLEVAQSLAKRSFTSTALGLHLWLAYNRQLLACLRPEDRIITHYDVYFHDPVQELARVLAFLGIPASHATMEQAAAAASLSLRHNRAVPELAEAQVPREVAVLYQALCAEAGPVYAQAAEQPAAPAVQAPTRGDAAAQAAWREFEWEVRVQGSGRLPERALLLGKRGLRVWRREGLGTMLRKGGRLAGRAFGPRLRLPRRRSRPPAATSEFAHRPPAYDLIVFAAQAWDDRPERGQHLARASARAGRRVFYVCPEAFRGGRPALRARGKNLLELTLPGPLEGEEPFTHLAALRKELGIVQAVCLLERRAWTPLARRLRAAFGWRLVYDAAGAGGDAPEGADLVLAAVPSVGAGTLTLANGADFTHFRFAPGRVPQEVAGLPQPLIGCWAPPGCELDVEDVRAVAEARPQWSLAVFATAEGGDLAALRACRNVHLLPQPPYGALPAYVHACRAGIVPLKSAAAAPSQLYDLLSAGQPTVVSDLPAFAGFPVERAQGPAQWVVAIERALAEEGGQGQGARFDWARERSWAQRAAELDAGLRSLYPGASIIILSYDNLDYSRLCLESLYAQTVYPSYEVIVVDNASQDGTVEFLQAFARSHPGFHLILNERNEGYPRANNQGLAAATGEYLVLLNNDTVLTRGWLSGLVRRLQDPQVGLVGPSTNGAPNESRIETDYEGLDEMHAFAARYTRDHDGEAFDIRTLTFFCVAMRRAVYEQAGPLDEAFGTGLFEDDDYALRVGQLGLRLVCTRDAYVHHWGQASLSRLGDEGFRRLFEENREKFEAKWRTRWKPHWPPV